MKAAIDIGSNTILLLVGQVQNGKVRVIEEQQYAPRLGRGVDAGKNLSEDAMQRAVDILMNYKTRLEAAYADAEEVAVVATSAVRDAGNRSHFVDRVKQETGYSVEILSGEREAELTYLGAQSVLNDINGAAAVIDVGGGSTEVAVGSANRMDDRHSFNMGSVRFTERYLPGDPPTKDQLQRCRDEIRELLDSRPFEWAGAITLIGVSGTATCMAAIALGHHSYQPQKLNGAVFERDDLAGMVRRLSKQTAEELLAANPQILKGRADVFLAGLLILHEFMIYHDLPAVKISTGGIRHGAILTT